MSKYCKPMGLYVTYLDCMECETKECKQNGGDTKMALTKRYLSIEPEQKVFLVFASKKEGYNADVVCRCKVKSATVYSDATIYNLKVEKIVLGKEQDKDVKRWVQTFMCENSNIDTGHRRSPNRYPVFTTKEKCIEWLKQI